MNNPAPIPAVTFNLYRMPGMDGVPAQLWASETRYDYLPVVGEEGIVLRDIMAGSAAALYRLTLTWSGKPHPWPGWFGLTARLQINQCMLGDSRPYAPLSWFVGEPTDFVTGLARWTERAGQESMHGRGMQPPAVWAIGARRSM